MRPPTLPRNLNSWRHVKELQVGPNKWQRFIDNWTTDGFKARVDLLATNLDEMAEAASPGQRAKMDHKFFETVRYEQLFWKLAFHGRRGERVFFGTIEKH